MPDGDPERLLGSWSLERLIEDRRTGRRSTASGRARLACPRQGLITWEEDVLLSYGGSDLAAHRKLRIERADDELWHVHFDDGRYFHPWLTAAPVIHRCGPDLYEGRIELDEGAAGQIASWRTRWAVHGPRKDQLILTHLTN